MGGKDNPTRNLYKYTVKKVAASKRNTVSKDATTTVAARSPACKDWPGCSNLAGACCPTPGGEMLYCCAQIVEMLSGLSDAPDKAAPLGLLLCFLTVSSVLTYRAAHRCA